MSAAFRTRNSIRVSGAEVARAPRSYQVSPKAVVAWSLMFSAIGVLPFFFGGAHASTFSVMLVLVGSLLLCTLLCLPLSFPEIAPERSLRRTTLWGLALLLTILSVETFVRGFSSEIHPLGGRYSRLVDTASARSSLLSFASFLATYFVSTVALSCDRKWRTVVRLTVIGSGVAVAFVALMHWFSDNGRLFWIFAPDNVFISTRARWPFVNPNHLGAFLLLPAFIIVARLVERCKEALRDVEAVIRNAARRPWFAVLNSRAIAKHMGGIVTYTGFLVIILVALLATQSRGAWAGALTGGVLCSILFLLLRQSAVGSDRHRSRGKDRRLMAADDSVVALKQFKVVRRLLGICLFGVISLSIAVILSGGGHERLESRIDFGISHSKDDVRLQLLEETSPLLTNHLLFGVGLGAWDEFYQTVRSPALANYDVGYLHSDPIQLLVEVGIVGVSPILVIVIPFIVSLLRVIRSEGTSHRVAWVIGGTSAMSSLLVASLFDFPFRMHSIPSLMAVLMAITIFELDRSQKGLSGGSEGESDISR